MRKYNPNPLDVFNYLRGALRGRYGVEDFRGKSILLVGINRFGQSLLNKICFDQEVTLYFAGDPKQAVRQYHNALSVCSLVEPWTNQKADIVIDTLAEKVTLGSKTVPFKAIGAQAYTQGIHDFYPHQNARGARKWSRQTQSTPSNRGKSSWRGSRK